MNTYLLGVIGTVLFSAVLTLITPDGKTGGIVKASARLACLVAIISPVLIFFQSGRLSDLNFTNSIIEMDESFIEYCSKINVEQTEKELEKCIEEEFGLPCEVSLLWQSVCETEDKYQIFKVKIIKVEIYATMESAQAVAVKDFVEKKFSCETEIKNGG